MKAAKKKGGGKKTRQKPVIQCKQCKKRCQSLAFLKKHEKEHLKIKQKEQGYTCHLLLTSAEDSDTKLRHCNKKFQDKSAYNRHLKRHQEKLFLCSQCPMQFARNDELLSHERIHSDFKPYKCQLCNACFKHSSSLSVHKRKHTDCLPYKCSVCDMAFPKKSRLSRHSNTHTGLSAFECIVCQKLFKQRVNLTHHLLKQHSCKQELNSLHKKFEKIYSKSAKEENNKPRTRQNDDKLGTVELELFDNVETESDETNQDLIYETNVEENRMMTVRGK